MSNPYQAPETSGIPTSRLGLAGHVPVIAALLITQGALEVIGGLMALVTGVVMAVLPSIGPPNAGGDKDLPPYFFAIVTSIYASGGVVALSIGGLKIWGGWQNWGYRSRTLGIVAACSGFASLLTCYCGPSGVALAVYGLIVYLNARTVEAFALREQGHTPEQIRGALS